MFSLRTLFHTDRNHSPRGAARLQIEQLEGRALPSGFGSLLPTGGLGAVVSDLTQIRSDVQAVTRALGSNASGGLATVRAGLRTLVGDVLAGKDTTQDLKTLAADEVKLLSGLGSNTAARVQRLFNNLQADLLSLSRDLTQIGMIGRGNDRDDRNEHRRGDDRDDEDEGHERNRGDDRDDNNEDQTGLGLNLGRVLNVITDLLSVRRDLQTLTGALGSGISQTVSNALNTVRSDIGTIIGDLLTGQSPTSALTTLNNDLQTLTTAIGTGASTQVQNALTTLTNDLHQLTSDVTALTNPLQAAFNRVQSDVTGLNNLLAASNLSQAAQNDLTALDQAITTLGNDVTAGNPITTDLTKALTSELTLLGELGSSLPAGARTSFLNLATDLVRLGLVPTA